MYGVTVRARGISSSGVGVPAVVSDLKRVLGTDTNQSTHLVTGLHLNFAFFFFF